jgi:hypothetical protein
MLLFFLKKGSQKGHERPDLFGFNLFSRHSSALAAVASQTLVARLSFKP